MNMKRRILLAIVVLCLVAFLPGIEKNNPQSLLTPAAFFGFEPGTDRMLFDYESMIKYFTILEKQSQRIKMVTIGQTAMGRPLHMVCISAEKNIANLDELKKINHALAVDYTLTADQVKDFKSRGRVFVLGTLSMHSSEVGPSQAAPTIAYKLASADDPLTLQWLEHVVYMMVPCHNPDGMNLVNKNYMKNKGTKYEASSLPGLYHKYAGHNINRDFVMLTQPENKAISLLTSKEWFPQVMVEKHQMGITGVRYFVPPNHDPIAQNIDETLWSWVGIFGANMLNDMTALGQTGIAQSYIFDNYWPGSTETCLWKNVISFLTEAASVKTATPVFIEKNELKAQGKGLAEYKKGANLIAPWENGWWRLGDIVNYEISSTLSILKTAALHREKILEFRHDICRKEYAKGLNNPPYYYILPHNQHDGSELAQLIALLREHGIVVNQLTKDVVIEKRLFSKGDVVLRLAQPFRAFIKEVMEIQQYPERRDDINSGIIKPYDITSWSLPLNMGVQSIEVSIRSLALEESLTEIERLYPGDSPDKAEYLVFQPGNNESYRVIFSALAAKGKAYRVLKDIDAGGSTIASGSFVIPASHSQMACLGKLSVQPKGVSHIELQQLQQIKLPSIAVVETWQHDMDAGWTRYVFDSYAIPYSILRPDQLADSRTFKNFELIIFPNQHVRILIGGIDKNDEEYRPANLPAAFSRGMGKPGKKNLLDYIDRGGKVLAWGQSCELFVRLQELSGKENNQESFVFPVKDCAPFLKKRGLEVISAHVAVSALPQHKLTLGMPETFPIFFSGNLVFETSIPNFDMDRRVILWFSEGNPAVSGYVKNGEYLANKAAMVWIKKGLGEIVMYAFCPQFRGQTSATFKLIFNALMAD